MDNKTSCLHHVQTVLTTHQKIYKCMLTCSQANEYLNTQLLLQIFKCQLQTVKWDEMKRRVMITCTLQSQPNSHGALHTSFQRLQTRWPLHVRDGHTPLTLNTKSCLQVKHPHLKSCARCWGEGESECGWSATHRDSCINNQ